jgi:hypothetical protein
MAYLRKNIAQIKKKKKRKKRLHPTPQGLEDMCEHSRSSNRLQKQG